MKFGGLFDCANLKVHGLGLLIYDDFQEDQMNVAFGSYNTAYEAFVNNSGLVVNPLNYAPPPSPDDKTEGDLKVLIPITQLKHLPSPLKNDSKDFKIRFHSSENEREIDISLS